MTESHQLLAEYARNGSDVAFRELVVRFVDLVYSTALRLVEGDTHRAEDITQTVFVDLARKARTLPADVRLGGWLHRDTCLVAGHTMRGERRRHCRERQAVEMNMLHDNSETDFSLVAPVLDEAINELGEADRTAILLRFFEQQDFRSIGQALDSSEDAARMRVTRALQKLEEFLKRQGVTTSTASLGLALTANAVQAAPVGLVVTISTAAALTWSTTAGTASAAKFVTMTTLQKTAIAATVLAAVGTAIYQAHQASSLRTQIQDTTAPFEIQIRQLTSSRDDGLHQLEALRDDNQRLNLERAELPRLRGEVAKLQAEAQRSREGMSNLQSQLASVAQDIMTNRVRLTNVFDVRTLRDVGTRTLEDALQTLLYAISTHDMASLQRSSADPGQADHASSFHETLADQLQGLSQIGVQQQENYLDGSVLFQCSLKWNDADATNHWRWLAVRMRPSGEGWGLDEYSPSGIRMGAFSRQLPTPRKTNQP